MSWRILIVSITFSIFCSVAEARALEVHALGIYEGNTITNGEVHGPEARVTVDRPNADVILVLGSYEAVRWIIDTSPQTKVETIYLHGKESERSKVTLNGAPFKSELLSIGSTYQNQGYRFRDLIKFLSFEFNVPRIASFQGAYAAPEETFVVDTIQRDAVNQIDYLRHQIRPEALTDNLRMFLKQETEPVARLEKDGFYLRRDGLERHFPITLDVPKITRPGLAAYDPVHQRLFAGTAWHVGYFYTYNISNDSWSAFKQPSGVSVHGVIYDADNERIFLGVEGTGSRGLNSSRFVEMSSSGDVTEIKHDILLGLTDFEDPGNGPAATVVPISIDGDLLLAKAVRGHLRKAGSQAYRLYLINVNNGEVNLVEYQN